MPKRQCPNCKRQVTGHPNKKFCGQKCKDRYHNRLNPRGYGARSESVDGIWHDDAHPFSSDALGQD